MNEKNKKQNSYKAKLYSLMVTDSKCLRGSEYYLTTCIQSHSTMSSSASDVKVELSDEDQEDHISDLVSHFDEVNQLINCQQNVVAGSLGGPTVTPLDDVVKCEPEVIQGLDAKLLQTHDRAPFYCCKSKEVDSPIDNGCTENKENMAPTQEEQNQSNFITYPKTYKDHTKRDYNSSKRNITHLFLCDHCKYSCCKKREIVEHMRVHNPLRQYKCDDYEKTFAKNCNDLEQKNNNYPIKLFKCDKCDYITTNKCSMVDHVAIHSNIQLLKCSICVFSTTNKSSLKKHHKAHSTEPYTCPICRDGFKGKKELHEHILFHDGAAPLECHMCGRIFRRISTLKQHALRHISSPQANPKKETNTESKPFECAKCKFRSDTIKGLNIHRSVHVSLRCAECNYTTKKQKLLQHHMVVHNKKVSDPKKCTTKTVFNANKHSGVKRFKCAICSYSSNRNQDLRRHQSVHSTMKNYRCAECDYVTKRNDMLMSHMVVHRQSKQYICDVCGFAFRWKSAHCRHLATHRKGKVYKCTDCDFVCNRKDYLKQHETVHNDVKPYVCDICEAIYRDKDTLRKHITRKHLDAV